MTYFTFAICGWNLWFICFSINNQYKSIVYMLKVQQLQNALDAQPATVDWLKCKENITMRKKTSFIFNQNIKTATLQRNVR